MGATLALPLLDAMVPAMCATASAAAVPRRLGFIYIPNGVNMLRWKPGDTTAPLQLSPTLAPLEPFREKLVAISHLSSRPADSLGDGSGEHCRGCNAWLSGAHAKKTEGADFRSGKTIDQYAADELGRDTQFPSLQLAIDEIGMLGGFEPGFASVYSNTLSWRTSTTPMPMQVNPRVVFERLMGGDARTPEEKIALARSEASILDALTGAARRMKSGLGATDRARLDDYLTGVRELEIRIKKLEQQADVSLSSNDLPAGIPDSFEEHVKLMFDLQVLAFRADLTRVVALMMSREITQRTYNNIGVPDPHHGLSHHAYDPLKLEKQAKIDTYHVTLLRYFLEKLQETRDGDGSLLDHSLIMYGGGMSDSQIHSHHDLPTLIAGGGNGRVRGGRHIVCPVDTPLANLELALLDKVDIHLDEFGDHTGRLSEL
jgi:hypothetical protein